MKKYLQKGDKTGKQILCLLLALVMATSLISTTALAQQKVIAEPDQEMSQELGESQAAEESASDSIAENSDETKAVEEDAPLPVNESTTDEEAEATSDAAGETDSDEKNVERVEQEATAGEATITASYDSDAFDEKVQLSVEEVQDGDSQYDTVASAVENIGHTKFKAYDIMFLTEDGIKMEPTKAVAISIRISEKWGGC